jgi:hypothetical protein
MLALDLKADFFEALGRFTAAWAYVELGADCLGAIIFHGYGGKKIRPNIPYSLDRKIDYLREAFKTLPDLLAFADRAIPIIERFAAMRVDRHDFIHGLHGNLDERGKIVSGRLRYVPDNLFMNRREVTTPQMVASSVVAWNVAHDLIGLCLQLSDHLQSMSGNAATPTDRA